MWITTHSFAKNCVAAVFFLMVGAFSTTQAQVPSWQARGIGGGGALMDPSISPFDQRLFVACDMSELFASADFGTRWNAINHRQIQGNRGSRVQFSSDPLVLYSIDHTGELPVPAISRDGGTTWSRVSTNAWPTTRTAYSLFVDPSAQQRLVVGDDRGVWISNDAGVSFQQSYQSSAASGLHLAGAFFDGSTIYLGSSEGLLLSTNAGLNFQPDANAGIPADAGFYSFAGARNLGQLRLLGSVVNRAALYPGVFPEDLYGSAYRGLYTRDVPQSNWQLSNVGIAANDRPALVAMAINDTQRLVAAGAADPNISEAPAVYRSSNGGVSWSAVFATTNNQNIATGWAGAGGDRGFSYGGALIGLAVAPNNADRIAISDYGFVHLSSDGGAHWRQAYVNPADQNPEATATPQRRSYRSAGIENTSVWSLAWASATQLFAGFSDIRGIRSTDAGLSWSFDYTGHSLNTMYHVQRHNSGVLYGATSSVHDLYQSTHLSDSRIDSGSGRLLRSADAGQSWSLVHDFGRVLAWVSLDPTNAERALVSVAHSSTGGIYFTNNLSAGAASTWTALPAPPRTQGHPNVIRILADGAIVATYSGRRAPGFTASSGLFYKADLNAPWQDRSDPGMHYWSKDVVLDPHDAAQNTFYVAVYSGWGGPANALGGLYRSLDRGLTWRRISALDRVESITISPTDPNFAYLTTEMEGLWFSRDLRAATPHFEPDLNYPFRQPLRSFFNPFDSSEVWISSFGGGLRVGRMPSTANSALFTNGFE